MSTVTLHIAPENAADIPAGAPGMTAEVEYVRDLGAPPDGSPPNLPTRIVDVVRTPLDERLSATVTLTDAADASTVTVRVLAGTGAARVTTSITLPSQATTAKVVFTKNDIALATAVPPRPLPAGGTALRSVRFVPFAGAVVPFAAFRAYVAPLPSAADAWKVTGLDQLFQRAQPATIAAELPQIGAWPNIGSIEWTETHLAADGTASLELAAAAGSAWLWWLSGPTNAVGAVLDNLAAPADQPIAVALPPLAAIAVDDPMTHADGRVVPAAATEAEIANNPQVYAEDPGAFCKPFSNPERVLGEKSFHVIVRAEQPLIGPEPSIRTHAVEAIDFDPPQSLLDRSLMPRPGVLAAAAPATSAVEANFASVVESGIAFKRRGLPADYLEALRRSDRGRRPVDSENPPPWEGDVSRYQAATIARGHILEFRLRWRSNGYSLGTVAKTLTLAPRQVKRIQKIEWNRIERGRRDEQTRIADRVSEQVQRERSYEDHIQANLSEWARGESESTIASGAGGFGFAAAGFVIGGGGGHSNASTEASQSGGRRTTAAEQQRLEDAIRRHAEALRRIESVVVNEVTQEETVTGTTEVIRNINYSHALTVIYYQILRHLRVDTEFAGVRECLFVPFAIKPFTIARAYRWRELIARGLRDRRHLQAVRYLRDVLTGFASSSVPPGRRADQPIRHIQGSAFVRLALERPADAADGQFDDEAWAVVRSLLGMPAMGIQAQVRDVLARERERVFQSDHAPRMAAAWSDALQVTASGQILAADFTLASRYQFNSVVRIDFTVAAASGPPVTREMLGRLRFSATKDLPPGSVANLERVTFTYQTDHYRRSVHVDHGAGDLIIVETGERDAQGAALSVPPDQWERQDLRADIVKAANDLVRHLNEHVEHYHKVIWWNMDRDRLFMLIDGFFAPGLSGVSVASVAERDPIAIIGNALVFRVSSGAFIGIDDLRTPAQLYNYYADRQLPRDPLHVSLPTDGLYAQTIMDECEAIEEHLGNTDWVLNDKEPELIDLPAGLLATRRADTSGLTPTPFGPTIINMQNAPDAPPPQGLAGILTAIANPNAFRDMTGLAGTQANARAGLEAAAGLASSFGAQAAALKLADMAAKERAAQSADQKLASVERAVQKELLPGVDAEHHATKILESLHEPTSAARPHQDPVLAQAIRQAVAQPGSDIHVATPEGEVRVQLAQQVPPAGGAPAPAPAAVAAPPRVDGIDMHAPHPFPSISDLRADGIQFVILKASEGVTFVDARYATRHATAMREHFVVGGYHFWRSNRPSVDQANNLIAVVGRLVPGDLPATLDFEHGGLTAANVQDHALVALMEQFLDRVETALGRSPMIYTSRVVWRDWLHNLPAFSRFGDYPLWVKQYLLPENRRYARRLTRNPALPAAWQDWTIWQYSGDYTPVEYANLHAADRNTDLNVSNGGTHVLRGLADLGRPGAFGDVPRFVAYTDDDGTLRMLVFLGFWLERNLSQVLADQTTGAQPLAGGDLAGVEHRGTTFVAFRGRADNHIYESNLADTFDLTATVGGAAAVGDPMYVTDGADRYLLYWGDDNHQYLLKNAAGTWQVIDVTQEAGLLPASGNARGYVEGGHVHVVGRAGADGHLVDAFHDGTQWRTVDLMSTGAPAATYQPAVYIAADNFQRFVYRALRGSIQQIDHHVNVEDLSALSGGAPTCSGNPAAFAIAGHGHVVYRRVDGQLHEIHFDGTQWRHRQLPCVARAAADPVAYAASATTGITVFRDRDGVFHQLTLADGHWRCEEIEGRAPAPPDDDEDSSTAPSGEGLEGLEDLGDILFT